MTRIEPALTEREWAEDPHPTFRGERLGVYNLLGIEITRYPSGVEIRGAGESPPVFVDIAGLHALAALCLDNRRVRRELWPSGFTWDDVNLLRAQADVAEALGENEGDIVTRSRDLADRIEALLPPRYRSDG